ncbi:MAG: diguanylate cyclase [Alphaproteobacteria bacterium]|nr:diguanylate cyclase [Alphaproteobacteria bacterium]
MKPLSTVRTLGDGAIDGNSGPNAAACKNATVAVDGQAASLAHLPGPVLHINSDGAIVGLNEEGTYLAHSLHEGDAAQCLAQLRALASTAAETSIQSVSWSEESQTRWMEATVIPTDDGGAFIVGRDSTLEINMRLALVDSRQRFKDLVDVSSDFAWETDTAGTFVFVSPRGALGYSADAMVGTVARDLLYRISDPPSRFAFEAQDIIEETELWLKNADGNAACVLASAKPVWNKLGERTGARGVCRDITAERLRENDIARMKVREQVIAYVVDAVRDEARPTDMLSTAVTSIGKAMTDTACAVYQRESRDSLNLVAHYGSLPESRELAEAIDRVCTDFAAHEDFVGGHRTLMTATHYRNDMNGAILLSRESETEWNAHDRSLIDAVAGQLGIALQQVSDQKELERLSRTDALTGLFNRRAFTEELERAIHRSRRNGFQSAVFFVDLNNFKAVNDTHGHDVGDRVLTRLSDILRAAARSYDFVARLGGDEFALWFENIDKQAARRRAGEIIRNCKSLDQFSGAPDKRLGLSIGIAMDQPNSVETSDGLLKRADAAMYRAKHSRKHSISMARDKTSPQ